MMYDGNGTLVALLVLLPRNPTLLTRHNVAHEHRPTSILAGTGSLACSAVASCLCGGTEESTATLCIGPGGSGPAGSQLAATSVTRGLKAVFHAAMRSLTCRMDLCKVGVRAGLRLGVGFVLESGLGLGLGSGLGLRIG